MGVKNVGYNPGLMPSFAPLEGALHRHAPIRASRAASSNGIIATIRNI